MFFCIVTLVIYSRRALSCCCVLCSSNGLFKAFWFVVVSDMGGGRHASLLHFRRKSRRSAIANANAAKPTKWPRNAKRLCFNKKNGNAFDWPRKNTKQTCCWPRRRPRKTRPGKPNSTRLPANNGNGRLKSKLAPRKVASLLRPPRRLRLLDLGTVSSHLHHVVHT
jgi:hypothetical protein